MDKRLAKHVAMTAWQSFGRLERLIPLIKDHCDKAEFDIYLKGIASAGTAINHEILKRIFSEHPDLEADIETKVKKYQKWI
ncbi:MAG: hypothetical protein KGL11_12690 [Alphaproteobacteria bacterium]|nr:hypothetical protein [Alphaproteobacteria bacterium]